jgi:PKD repeat protein
VYHQPSADFTLSNAACVSDAAIFTDQSDANGGTITDWSWDFGDGAPGSTSQNPLHTFTIPGTFMVNLTIFNNGVCSDVVTKQVEVAMTPGLPDQPTGKTEICPGSTGNLYTTAGSAYATSYHWELSPSGSGTIQGISDTAIFTVSPLYSGVAYIIVTGNNGCGEGPTSTALAITVTAPGPAPQKPQGVDSVNIADASSSQFITTGFPTIPVYAWFISPANAGTISGTDRIGTVTWDNLFRGPTATITVKAIDSCGPGLPSDGKVVNVKNTIGVQEINGNGITIFPNPGNGKFTISFTGNFTDVNIRIINTMGSAIYTDNNIRVSGKLSHDLDLSTIPAGIYFLKVQTDNRTIIRKLVIRK